MNRKQQLKFCKSCKHQKRDFNRGIVCSLTDDYPTFEGSCSSYVFGYETKEVGKEITKEEKKQVKINTQNSEKVKILNYCRICNHGKIRDNKIVCDITNNFPNFEGECKDFNKNEEKAKKVADKEQALIEETQINEIKKVLAKIKFKFANIQNPNLDEIIREVENGAKFVVFKNCISIIVMTYRSKSNIYYIKPGESATVKGLPDFFLSILLGWWGIPWGPIYTLDAIFTNLSGGTDVTTEVLTYLSYKEVLKKHNEKKAKLNTI